MCSGVLVARARAQAGMEAGGAGAGAHLSEAAGRQRLAEAVGRLVGPTGARAAADGEALAEALLP